MFIDPHLDPRRANYAEFIQLLLAARRPSACPAMIQIHRVCYEGHGPDRRFPNWREVFDRLNRHLANAGVAADVFIWNDFHDRYLITNLIGIQMGNGFDISGNPNEMTTWARISRADRVNIQREFDYLNNTFHELRDKFTIGRRD
jgi:hypothetical protein